MAISRYRSGSCGRESILPYPSIIMLASSSGLMGWRVARNL